MDDETHVLLAIGITFVYIAIFYPRMLYELKRDMLFIISREKKLFDSLSITEEYIVSHFSGIGRMDLSFLFMVGESHIRMSDPDAISCWEKLKKRLRLYALLFMFLIVYTMYRMSLLH